MFWILSCGFNVINEYEKSVSTTAAVTPYILNNGDYLFGENYFSLDFELNEISYNYEIKLEQESYESATRDYLQRLENFYSSPSFIDFTLNNNIYRSGVNRYENNFMRSRYLSIVSSLGLLNSERIKILLKANTPVSLILDSIVGTSIYSSEDILDISFIERSQKSFNLRKKSPIISDQVFQAGYYDLSVFRGLESEIESFEASIMIESINRNLSQIAPTFAKFIDVLSPIRAVRLIIGISLSLADYEDKESIMNQIINSLNDKNRIVCMLSLALVYNQGREFINSFIKHFSNHHLLKEMVVLEIDEEEKDILRVILDSKESPENILSNSIKEIKTLIGSQNYSNMERHLFNIEQILSVSNNLLDVISEDTLIDLIDLVNYLKDNAIFIRYSSKVEYIYNKLSSYIDKKYLEESYQLTSDNVINTIRILNSEQLSTLLLQSTFKSIKLLDIQIDLEGKDIFPIEVIQINSKEDYNKFNALIGHMSSEAVNNISIIKEMLEIIKEAEDSEAYFKRFEQLFSQVKLEYFIYDIFDMSTLSDLKTLLSRAENREEDSSAKYVIRLLESYIDAIYLEKEYCEYSSDDIARIVNLGSIESINRFAEKRDILNIISYNGNIFDKPIIYDGEEVMPIETLEVITDKDQRRVIEISINMTDDADMNDSLFI